MAIFNSYVKLPEGNSRAWRLRYSHRSSDIFLNVFFGIDTQIPKQFAPRSCFWCCAWICPSPHMFPWISWGSTADGPGFWIDEGTGKNRNGGLKSHPDPMFEHGSALGFDSPASIVAPETTGRWTIVAHTRLVEDEGRLLSIASLSETAAYLDVSQKNQPSLYNLYMFIINVISFACMCM